MPANPYEPKEIRLTPPPARAWSRRWMLACLMGFVTSAGSYAILRANGLLDAGVDKQIMAEREGALFVALVSILASGFLVGVIGAAGWIIASDRERRTAP